MDELFLVACVQLSDKVDVSVHDKYFFWRLIRVNGRLQTVPLNMNQNKDAKRHVIVLELLELFTGGGEDVFWNEVKVLFK